MNTGMVRVLLILFLALLAFGCKQQTLRDDGGAADTTGNIGSPLVGPSPADVYIDLSGAYLRENRLTEAFMNAKKAVIVDPKSSNAHYILALVYQRLGETGSAEASYRKAISLDPRNPGALNAYGLFKCGQKEFDVADDYFRRALNNPLYATPWIASHNAGDCARQAGDLESARFIRISGTEVIVIQIVGHHLYPRDGVALSVFHGPGDIHAPFQHGVSQVHRLARG